jgi:hypothetical protein
MRGRLIRFRLRRSQVRTTPIKRCEGAGGETMETLIFACAGNFVRIDLRPPFARSRERPAWTRRSLRSKQRKYDLERGPKGPHSQKSACRAVSGACAPTGVRHANSRIYRGGRHVVNRAHRRTISAAPQDVSQSRRNSNVGCCSGVARGESLGGSHVRSISDHTPLRCQQ